MAQSMHQSAEVQASLEDVFTYWSNFEHFPQIMRNIEEVQVLDEERSHWRVNAPFGRGPSSTTQRPSR